jgi:protein-L-isoaspartate(D-aspartate) O-methyltransferase
LKDDYRASSPYNVIILEGACEMIPVALLQQLAEGGRLIAIQGQSPGKATVYRCTSGKISSRPVFEAGAASLPGFSKPRNSSFS